MRTTQTFMIYFFIRKKKNKPEEALLYARISVNGIYNEMSLKRSLEVSRWNQSACKLNGSSMESQQLNKKIDDTKALLYKAYDSLQKEDQFITASAVKSRYLGIDKKHYTLTQLLDYHSTKMKGVLKYGTLKNYTTTETYLKNYLKEKRTISDIYLKQIDYQFTLGFERFLRDLPSLSNNGVMKHMERFKKLMHLSEDLDWIEKNPTKRFKLRFHHVDMVYLSKAELQKIKEKKFKRSTLSINRDIFVFCCYTGLPYGDVLELKKKHIQIGIDGKKWIYTRRMKTNTLLRIPLLEEAERILEKYKEHPRVSNSDILLPVYSNQKTNQYLREITKAVKINKELSFHAARHTFATTVTLANGVPIETVSKLLGHTKLSTTQIYARVIDSKISNDMDKLRGKV